MNIGEIRELIADLRGTEWNMSTPQELADLIADRLESALRQSQSLPAGAVADDAGQREYDQEILNNLEQLLRPRKWLGRWDEIVRQLLAEFDAIQADAREKGEAVFRLYPEELARMTHGPSLRAEEEDRFRSIYGDVAIPLYLHSGDYTEAMLLLEKQRELVENLRGQLDDAKADATDGCTEANCERCNTAIHSRGDMRHAGIGTYPATQPAQASEKCKVGHDEWMPGCGYCAEQLPEKTMATHPQPVTPAGGEVYVASSDVEAMVALKGRVADAGSQSRYAKSVGVSEAYVSDVLNGKRPIPEAWIPGFAKGWLRVNTHPPVADAALVRDAERLLRSADALAACVMSVDGYSRGELIAFAENFRNDVAALNQRGGDK